MEQFKKRKGGAEKQRDKKKKSLEADASKYKKITEFSFGHRAAAAAPSTSVEPTSIDDDGPGDHGGAGDTADSEHPAQRPPQPGRTRSTIDMMTTEKHSQQGTDSRDQGKKTQGKSQPAQQRHPEPRPSTSDMMTEDDPATYSQEVSALPSKVDHFTRPKPEALDRFFTFHPQQKAEKAIVQRAFFCKDGTNRKWLSYSEDRHALFCSLCMAFAKPTDSSSFITGMTNLTHIHQRVEEHERSNLHRGCAEAYFLRSSKSSVQNLLMGSHREQVRKRRQVLERIIDVVKLIGKMGLSYRGSQSEAAYMLDDDAVDHGNFLEIIILLGKYDVCLKEHLTLCIEKSKKIHQSGSRGGRGSLVTLLSKTTVSNIITTIPRIMKATIATEVQESGMFSVQIDTTQDITAQDQCSVIIRYVTDIIHKRLVAVIKCEASTGQYFVQVVSEVLVNMNLDVKQCIGNSTDGASNMQGQYKGFSALLSEKSPHQVHVWCYAHILNLVLADTTQSVLASGSLFSLINNIAVFIRESYQRMNIWEKESKDPRHRRLAPIGETRWWAKDSALSKVFGAFGKPDGALFVDVLHTLSTIQDGQNINTTARVNARGYIAQLLKYETILTAQLFLRIFQVTSPVSKYLQTSGMDILTAHRMIVSAETQLKGMARDFQKVKTAADTFVQWANNKVQEQNEETELEVDAALPQKRGRRKKSMPGEMSRDETVTDAETSYRIDVHNRIMDTVTESMHQRFLKNGTLYADFALLDPKNFSQVTSYTCGFPEAALQDLSKCLLPFDDRATVPNLQSELISLAGQWDRLKTSVFEEYTSKTTTEVRPEEGAEDEVEMVNKKCSSCKDCPLCCYRVLRQYNLLTDAYHIIGLAYKFLLTLSVTQVACERSFSTLKFIKHRLRSSLSQQHLEACMLMATQPDVLKMLDSDNIIDGVAEKSELLRKLLI